MPVTGTFHHLGSEITALNPLPFGPLDADIDEVSPFLEVVFKLPLGYRSVGDVTFDCVGASDAMFQLSPDSGGVGAVAYGEALTYTDPLVDDDPGLTLYVRAKAVAGQTAQVDVSTSLTVSVGIATAV